MPDTNRYARIWAEEYTRPIDIEVVPEGLRITVDGTDEVADVEVTIPREQAKKLRLWLQRYEKTGK